MVCPELWNKSPETTLRHIARLAAAAEELRARWPGQLVFSVGTGLTLYMRGIVKGRTYHRRIPAIREAITSAAQNGPQPAPPA